MVFPKNPIPGQKVNASWGSDLVKAVRRMQPQGGNGMRVTCGPNGSTYYAVGRGSSTTDSTERGNPFRLAMRSVRSSGATTKYAVIYFNEGDAQTDGYLATCANQAATGMSSGWYDVAYQWDESEGALEYKSLNQILTASGNTVDVFGKAYWDSTGNLKIIFDNSEDWPDSIAEEDRVSFFYVGTYKLTIDASSIKHFTVSVQTLKSGLVLTDTDEEAGYPFKLSVYNTTSGSTISSWVAVQFESGDAQWDGNVSATDNRAASIVSGSDVYDVAYSWDDTTGAATYKQLSEILTDPTTAVDIYAMTYLFKGALVTQFTMQTDYPTFVPLADRLEFTYVGTIGKTTEDGATVYSVTKQALRSGLTIQQIDKEYPFRLIIDTRTESSTDKFYPMVDYFYGSCQYGADLQQPVCVNTYEGNFFNIPVAYNSSGTATYSDLATAFGSTLTSLDVFAFVYNDEGTPTIAFLLADSSSAEWPSYIAEENRIDAFCIGSIDEETVGSNTHYYVSVQAVRSAARIVDSTNEAGRFDLRFVRNANGTWNGYVRARLTYVNVNGRCPSTLKVNNAAPTAGTDGYYQIVSASSLTESQPVYLHIYGSSGTAGYAPIPVVMNVSMSNGTAIEIPATANTISTTDGYRMYKWNVDGVSWMYRITKIGYFMPAQNKAATNLKFPVTLDSDIYTENLMPTGGGGGSGANVSITGSDSEATANILTSDSAGPTGSVVLTKHSKVLGSAVNPAGTAGGTVTYNNGSYNTLSGLVSAMMPSGDRFLDESDVTNGFVHGSNTVLSTKDLYDGVTGTITGDVVTYHAGANGEPQFYKNPYLTANKVIVLVTQGSETSAISLSGYFNTATGTIKYNQIGTLTSSEEITSKKAVGFDGSTSTPVNTSSLIDVAVPEPKGDEATAANAPKPDVCYGPSGGEGTDAQKIARIGTSEYAAREDHVHPIEVGVGTIVEPQQGMTGDTKPSQVTLDDTTWSVGTNGVEIPICVRTVIYTAFGEERRYFVYRKFKWAKNGNLISISEEYLGFVSPSI